MKTESLNQTGPAVALKIAYDAVKENLNYSHKRLRDETGLTYNTLRKIRNGDLGRRSPVIYYLHVLMRILHKAYSQSIIQMQDGATKAVLIKNVWAEIACELCNMHMPKVPKKGCY